MSVEDDLALLGLLPLIPYAVMLYVAFRMPHVRSGGFALWILGWVALALYVLFTSTVRISIVINTLAGTDTFRLWRFLTRFAGDLALMVFVLTQRLIFPSDQTLWDDIRADSRRLYHIVQWLVRRLHW